MTRRDLLMKSSSAALTLRPLAAIGFRIGEQSAVQAILNRIKAPTFPPRDFDVTNFGATSTSGDSLYTEAINKAVEACSIAGGGRVVIPAGIFRTAAIHLQDNVNLHLSKGATLAFSTDPKDYLPLVFTRFESTECMNYSPLIYAHRKHNIAVTGPGILDGQADAENWWSWKSKSEEDRKNLVTMGERDVPVRERVFGQGHRLRPNFVQFVDCTNVLLEDFTIKRSPMWELNPVLCRNVTVRHVRIDSHGPNNDGIDPECCRDVLISNCEFNTGDDCIAIKSGRNRDGRRVNVPCENIVIQNCSMADGHGGVSIGSEVSGGIRNIYIRDCKMQSPHLERGLRIKTNSFRGGIIENIEFANVEIGEVRQAAVEIDFFYEEGEGGPFNPSVTDVHISNVRSQKSRYGVFLRGFETVPIQGVSITDCSFANASEGNLLQHVKSIELRNVQVNGELVRQ